MKTLGLVNSWALTACGSVADMAEAILNDSPHIQEKECAFRIRDNRFGKLDLDDVQDVEDKFVTAVVTAVMKTRPLGAPMRNDGRLFIGTSMGVETSLSPIPRSTRQKIAARLAIDPGRVVGVHTTCASSLDALMVAASSSKRTREAVTVVGVEVISDARRLAHSKLGTLATGPYDPAGTSANGIVLGEGVGACRLGCDLNNAESRNGYLAGWGAVTGSESYTRPDTTGRALAEATLKACAMAKIAPTDINAVMMHGTGTQLNRVSEDRGLDEALGVVALRKVKRYYAKGYTGHTFGASGIVELLVLAEILRRRHRAHKGEKYGLKLVNGFGGHVRAMIVGVTG